MLDYTSMIIQVMGGEMLVWCVSGVGMVWS